MEETGCKDCRYYLPVDVFRGMCKLSKDPITPDDPLCAAMEHIPKCKFCAYYTTDKDYLGKCMGSILAYPDMIASKCADFKWDKQN
ncbi:MAG: 4-hydroxyphenylacetate decarboxylase small subunit [Bacteroidetes bacterium]|nr:4-hydroxyphenylacetate decarboxylase small subunit [Bacteroidota bacterium]